jgi:hypothetical protein
MGLGLGLGLGCGGAAKTHAPATATPAPARTLRFRRTTTGMIRATTTRETWTLELDARGTILRGVLERGAPSTIASLDAVAWETMGEVSYTAPNRIDAAKANVQVRLEKVGGDDALVLLCTTESLRVRVAGASLVHGDACGGDGPKPHWEPATTKTVEVLHCALPAAVTDDPESGARPFDFAEEPGVEWVYENSDCSAQEGSLRLMK